MLAHTCNPITREAETKGLTVQGQPGVHSKFQANLDYRNLLSKKNKPNNNTILSEEKLNVLPLRSETRQRCPLSLHLFNTVLEILARATIQKERENIQIGKKLNYPRLQVT
jgi:hypothetical protein